MEKSENLTLISGASFHRGSSKQNYATPHNFRSAVITRYGVPIWDLAANLENKFSAYVNNYYGETLNSLIQDWHNHTGVLWLNCPFSNIEPWAAKCREESKKGAHILFLVPASVGSCWFQMHVHNHAFVNFLNPRLCFDGKASYPKDCVLAEYGPHIKPGYDCWKWR